MLLECSYQGVCDGLGMQLAWERLEIRTNCRSENPRVKYDLEDLGEDTKIILKCI
jgi:hypothetical protein